MKGYPPQEIGNLMHDIEIRQSRDADMPSIDRLYPDAFPDEDLLPLVRHLVMQEPGILSLVAEADLSIAGHILFTTCGVTDSNQTVAMLAPLAVAPKWQRQGVGTALIRDGLKRLEQAGISQIYVLGDPAYYARTGFKTETGLAPPYPLPRQWRDAWQSLSLNADPPPDHGKLMLPEVWLQPALWGP